MGTPIQIIRKHLDWIFYYNVFVPSDLFLPASTCLSLYPSFLVSYLPSFHVFFLTFFSSLYPFFLPASGFSWLYIYPSVESLSIKFYMKMTQENHCLPIGDIHVNNTGLQELPLLVCTGHQDPALVMGQAVSYKEHVVFGRDLRPYLSRLWVLWTGRPEYERR
uniref:Uncharacterized protein n=1 Tax=Fundulus heteroclitus TaxID=8078 RepID=A0A3Q2TJX8_FUNHE